MKNINTLLLSFMVLLYCNNLQAQQNIVPNPSFETFQVCPSDTAQFTGNIANWYVPFGTPDLFNVCSTDAGVPVNILGTQTAASGESYGGFYAYAENDYREYLACSIADTPMEEGKTYCIQIIISLADNFAGGGIENVGMFFSPDSLSGNLLNEAPQLVHQNITLADTQDWMQIRGAFVAENDFNYFAVGNFSNNQNTIGNLTVPGTNDLIPAYYYIDDVSIVEIVAPEVAVSPLSYCENDVIFLTDSQTDNFSNYEWFDIDDENTILSTNAVFQTTASNTTYVVRKIVEGCALTDTITIAPSVVPEVFFTANNVCEGNVIQFVDESTGVDANSVYEWDIFNDGTIDFTTNGSIEYLFNPAVITQVKLTVSNGTCSNQFILGIDATQDCDPCTDINNFVPNGDAEIFDACPVGLNSEDDNAFDYVESWEQASLGTPDFFNACADNSNNTNSASIPNNTFGTQMPVSGNSYMGFYALRDDDKREYITTELYESLEAGKQYCLEMSVSLAERSSDAIGNLGIHFSNNSISDFSTETVLPITPTLETSGGFLTNTQTWSLISGIFAPTVTIDFLTIGNFRDNANTETTPNTHPNAQVGANLAYYYIDNISVFELPELLEEEQINTCVNDLFTITASDAYCSYNWELADGTDLGGGNVLETTFDTPGVYEILLVGTINSCQSVDLIEVVVENVPSASFAYSAACVGESTVLLNTSDDVGDNASFTWLIDGNVYVNSSVLGSVPVDFLTVGNYEVTLIAIDEDSNCQSSYTETIVISEICDECDAGDIILNGSFEFIGQCPDDTNQIENTLNWGTQNNNSIGYFNTCSTDEDAGVPDNQLGSQAAYDGFAYAGFLAYANNNARSNLYSVLETPMDAGTDYCVEFYVSCADNSELAVGNIGVYFLENNPIGSTTFSFSPQVSTNGTPITSAEGWVKVSGNFTAFGDYNYITIGNFDTNNETNTSNNGGNLPISYYYIDAISVTPFTVELPANQSICLGETLVLTAETDLCDYRWIDQSTGEIISTDLSLTVSPSQTSNYVFRANNETCGTIDRTVTVTVLDAPDLGPDVTICENGSTVLSINSGGNTVSWSPTTGLDAPNSATTNASPTVTTTYTVTIDTGNGDCPNTDEITVFVDQVNATISSSNNTICAGESVTTNVEGGDVFAWFPTTGVNNMGGGEFVLTPTVSTDYTITVFNSATDCNDIIEFSVIVGGCDQGGPQWVEADGTPVSVIYETTDVNTAIEIDFPTITDPDLPNDSFTLSATEPNNGTFDFNNISGTYTPNQGFVGNDTIIVSACDILEPIECSDLEIVITVFSENEPPEFPGIVNLNQFVNITVDSTWNFCFNIIDPEGGEVTLDIQDFPENGTAANLPGTFCVQYNPQGFVGTAQMTIVACDEANMCTTVNIFIDVDEFPLPPMVADTLFSAFENTPTSFCVGLFDANDNIESIEIIGDLSNGEVVIDDDGCMLFTPDLNFAGTDTLTLNICDSTDLCDEAEIIIVTADSIGANNDAFNIEESIASYFFPTDNDLPQNVDTLYIVEFPNIGTVEIVDSTSFASIIYYPPSEIEALDSLSYAICSEPFGCDTAWIYINVQDLLFVENDSTVTTINTNIDIDVSANDGTPDVDNNTFTLTVLSEPENGIIIDNEDGTFSYMPNDGFVGTDTFTYQVCSANVYGCSTIATVAIEVLNAGIPEPSIDYASTEVNTPVDIYVLDNDSDPQDSPISVFGILAASNGVAYVDSEGVVTYLPDIGFSGTDTLFYNIINEFGLDAQSFVVIEVAGCTIKIQEALTPNNDGFNDEWVISSLLNCGEFSENTVTVYNRWGNVVFEAENYGTNGWWNGTWQKNDEPLPVGTYFYVVAIDGQKSKDWLRGAIEIIR